MRRLGGRRRGAGILILSVAVSASLLRWAVSTTEITSGSMSPTLQGEERDGGDIVLVDRLTYRFRDPRRGEVVAFESLEGIAIMKRVAGLPGEEVAIEDGRVLVDGRPHGVEALDAIEYGKAGFLANGAVETRQGEYFVLGDFTSDSWDSRYWGGLERHRIHGRGVWILWPPGRFGPVR